MTHTGLGKTVITLLLLLHSSENFAGSPILPAPIIKPAPVPDTLYKNKTYRFSFIIPAGWEKQSGQANSDNVLFMQLPISNSCSFQFNVTPMSSTFPAEVAATTSLAAAYHDVKLNKLVAVKRRDTWIKEKTHEKDKNKEKIVLLTQGWEITEKPQNQKQQRIIYQVYDRQNRYFNFIAAAVSSKFSTCAPDLRKIMDSISFISF
jgi:PsbP